jgi:hypothetical protein
MRPGIVITTATNLVDSDGMLFVDLYHLVMNAWGTDPIIVLPNIPAHELAPVKEALRQHANADSLDTDVIIYDGIHNGQPKEAGRWQLGATDGHQLFVRLYTMEFFKDPKAWEILLPKLQEKS